MDDADDLSTAAATVLTHSAGKLTATEETLDILVTGAPKYAGAYTDTLTFTVAVG